MGQIITLGVVSVIAGCLIIFICTGKPSGQLAPVSTNDRYAYTGLLAGTKEAVLPTPNNISPNHKHSLHHALQPPPKQPTFRPSSRPKPTYATACASHARPARPRCPAQALKRLHVQRTGRAHTDAAPSPYKRACARLPVRVGTRGKAV